MKNERNESTTNNRSVLRRFVTGLIIGAVAAPAMLPRSVEADNSRQHNRLFVTKAREDYVSAQPKLIKLANIIARHRTQPGQDFNGIKSAGFKSVLSNGDIADITYGSKDSDHGKPNPNNPEFINVDVLPRDQAPKSCVIPVVSFSFIKDGNSWDATKTSSVAGHIGVQRDVSEIGQSSTHSLVESITSCDNADVVLTVLSHHSTNSASGADKILNDFESQAQQTLNDITKDRSL